MQGLRGQENDKFLRFFAIVQDFAKRRGCLFFADAGDGNECETDEMECEDLSGWLIPIERVAEFEPLFEKDNVSDDWSDFFCFAVWKNESDPTVCFVS